MQINNLIKIISCGCLFIHKMSYLNVKQLKSIINNGHFGEIWVWEGGLANTHDSLEGLEVLPGGLIIEYIYL